MIQCNVCHKPIEDYAMCDRCQVPCCTEHAVMHYFNMFCKPCALAVAKEKECSATVKCQCGHISTIQNFDPEKLETCEACDNLLTY